MRWRICECNYGYKNWEQVVLCGKLCTERSLLLSDLFCSSTCLWRCWRHDLHDAGHLEWLVLAQFCILTSCWIFLLFPRIKTGWIPLSILLFKSLSWHCATSADFCLIRVESSWGSFRDCPFCSLAGFATRVHASMTSPPKRKHSRKIRPFTQAMVVVMVTCVCQTPVR